MNEQITKYKVMSYREPGKMEMGWVYEGYIFVPVDTQNGYYAITPRKWIAVASCKPVTPSPVDPPPVDPPKTIIHIRTSLDGGITYDAGKYYEELP